MMQEEFTGFRAAQLHIQGLNVFQNGGIFAAFVLEIQRPFHRGEIFPFHADTANHQSGFRIPPGRFMSRLELIHLFRFPFHFPTVFQFGKTLLIKGKGKLRFRGERLLRVVQNRHVAQPHLAAIRQFHLRIHPIRLIAGNSVPAVAYRDYKFACPLQIHLDGNPRHSFFHQAGIEFFLPFHANREHNTAAAA
ncbi:MAG: hypothetical protein BWY71_02369 [Planctomycetes bacterium ADurb.Bin412]|nr:MAG: hypothetical protein BWY71_02369 [Planctomycetes bacterium ADurb.Bin412]